MSSAVTLYWTRFDITDLLRHHWKVDQTAFCACMRYNNWAEVALQYNNVICFRASAHLPTASGLSWTAIQPGSYDKQFQASFVQATGWKVCIKFEGDCQSTCCNTGVASLSLFDVYAMLADNYYFTLWLFPFGPRSDLERLHLVVLSSLWLWTRSCKISWMYNQQPKPPMTSAIASSLNCHRDMRVLLLAGRGEYSWWACASCSGWYS